MTKQVTAILVAFLLVGCASSSATRYNAQYESNAEREKQFSIDKNECWGLASSQIYVPDMPIYKKSTNPSGLGAFADGLAQGMNQGNAAKAVRDRDDLYETCMAKRGWVESKEEYNAQLAQKAAVHEERVQQAQAFFDAHPEYSTDKAKMERLKIEIKRVMNDPLNKGLDAGQLMLLAHEQVVKASK